MRKLFSLLILAAAIFGQNPATMAVNTWLFVANTRMDAVDPCPARNCTYSGVEGQPAVMNDWCGGIFDTKRNRLVVWGGGHNGYYGNELYAFDVDSMKWFRLTEPSTSLTFNQDPMANGMPLSRHTYGGMAYISHADRLFAMGGSGANSGSSVRNTWTFDFGGLAWTSKGTCGFGAGLGSTCAYDPATQKVYWCEGNNSDYNAWGLWTYEYAANRWTKLDDTRPYYYYGSAFDTKRGLLFIVGGNHVWVYDIKNANYTAQDWTTTNGSGIIGGSGVGLDYDLVADKIVGWNGGAVYALDADTKAWTSYNPSGAPTKNGNNTYGRWRYVPSVNAFISANQTTSNVYFYKLTSGMGTGVSKLPAGERAGFVIQASPNPFKQLIEIHYTGNAAGVLNIFSLKGQVVYKKQISDHGVIAWNPGKLGSGVYMLKITAGNKEYAEKLILNR